MRHQLVLAAAAIFTAFGIARADTIKIYTLSATLVDGSASGTLTLDQTTDQFTASNFSITGSAGTATFSGAATSTTTASTYSSYVFASNSAIGFAFDLFLPTPTSSLTSYSGGSICPTGSLCSTNVSNLQYLGANVDSVTSGTLTPVPIVAITPEPSSLMLLGTGVLVIGTFLRRSRA